MVWARVTSDFCSYDGIELRRDGRGFHGERERGQGVAQRGQNKIFLNLNLRHVRRMKMTPGAKKDALAVDRPQNADPRPFHSNLATLLQYSQGEGPRHGRRRQVGEAIAVG